MRRIAIGRLASAVPLLVLVSFIVFGAMHLGAGSVSESILGDGATPDRVAALDKELGLDRPFLVQYADWLVSAAQGDFGSSYIDKRAVADSVSVALPVTLSIAGGGILVAVLLGLGVGLVAAARPGGWADRLLTFLSSVALAVPAFWAAMLLSYYLGVEAGLFPASGYIPLATDPVGWFQCLILPSIALGLAGAGSIGRQMRGALIDVLRKDYIRTARAKGASPLRVLFRHAFRNAMVPVSTVIGFQAATMLGGSLVVERVFAMPGLSDLLVPAVLGHDFPVVLAIVVVTAIAVLAINLVIDLAYGFFDPKVRA
ncbi:ABC transporter permease [Nocardioides daejeonensis]|uniref:ABC transporter permease n=1 Tax=Nocardioides daejeonensis TaxID=1046556 RepID=UPI000D74B058|nr:ABC transporter permease [Nocardioides daejeonensis]